jgi:hypothetical protein
MNGEQYASGTAIPGIALTVRVDDRGMCDVVRSNVKVYSWHTLQLFARDFSSIIKFMPMMSRWQKTQVHCPKLQYNRRPRNSSSRPLCEKQSVCPSSSRQKTFINSSKSRSSPKCP